MFKTGESKVPLEKIPALAKALDYDVGQLMRLGLEQYWPDKLDVINKVFGRVVTQNEWEMIQIVRDATGDSDPEFDEKQKADLRRIAVRGR